MHVRAPSWTTAVALAVLVGCHDGPTRPNGALDVGQSLSVAGAFNLDMVGGGSVARYRSYLLHTAKSSPFAADDSLSTRGAAWNRLSVPGGSNATVTLGGPSASAGSHIQLAVVRTK